MEVRHLPAARVIPAVVAVLGVYVLLGWATGTEPMVRVLPHSVAMGVNTALLFVAAAAALLWPVAGLRSGPWVRALAYLLITLPIATLFEHITGIAIGIDWASLHALVKDGNPDPGRMAPNTCAAFLLIGYSLLGLSKAQPTKLQAAAIVLCTYGALAIGISAMIGYALNLEAMYRYAHFNRMAFPTAIGLTLLGISLRQVIRTRADKEKNLPINADIRITKTAIVVLTFVVAVTGFSGFYILKRGFDESMSATMQRSAKAYADAINMAIDQQLKLSDIIAARPGIQNGLIELEKRPRDPKTLALLGEIGKSFSPFGLTGFQLFDANGELVATIGSMVVNHAVMAMPLAHPTQQALLLWNNGFVLRNTNSVVREGRKLGYFHAEQRMTALTATMREMLAESASTDVLVCGRRQDHALCFPSKFYQANLRIPMYKDGKPHLAISRALLGERGVLSVADLRGVSVLAGFSPIGTLGLGLVHKADSVELYRPVRDRLNLYIGLLAFLVAMGTFLLRAQVQPLAHSLVIEQKRVQVLLDSSHEAFVEIDSAGVVRDWNAEAVNTFGWTRHEAVGKLLADLIIPEALREQHRIGMQRFLSSGVKKVIGKRLELPALHRSGREFTVEITISVVEDEGTYTFTAFMHDISDRKAAEEKLAQSESRLAQLARFDTLTGLPNRFQLHEKLEEAANRRKRLDIPLAVMFLDIDHFKQINDTLGHAAGDLVLKEFATRLKNCLRTTDTVGRLAGDEFVVFMETPHGADPAVAAQKIIHAMQKEWEIEGHILQVSTSIGIAHACVEKLSADALLAKADGALYKAKGAGRNQFAIEKC